MGEKSELSQYPQRLYARSMLLYNNIAWSLFIGLSMNILQLPGDIGQAH